MQRSDRVLFELYAWYGSPQGPISLQMEFYTHALQLLATRHVDEFGFVPDDPPEGPLSDKVCHRVTGCPGAQAPGARAVTVPQGSATATTCRGRSSHWLPQLTGGRRAESCHHVRKHAPRVAYAL